MADTPYKPIMSVADLEAFIGRTVKFQVETMYSQEQYDVVLL